MFTMELSVLERAPRSRCPASSSDAADTVGDDAAVARPGTDAYRGDAEAAAEFRRYTEADLLQRRRTDADLVAASACARGVAVDLAMLADAESTEMRQLRLDDDEVSAWLTLTAVRLVLATRLGIEDDTADLHHPGSASTTGWASDSRLLEAIELTRPAQGTSTTIVACAVGSSSARCRTSCAAQRSQWGR
jgi:hypothetical protein